MGNDWRDNPALRGLALSGRMTAVELRRQYSIPASERTVQRWIKDLRINASIPSETLMRTPAWAREDEGQPYEGTEIPDGIGFSEAILELEGDYGLSADWHIPHHDKKMLEWWIRECHRYGVGKAVLIGDGMDANQFSKRGKFLGYHRRWQEDVEVAEKVINAVASEFDEFVYIMGNHDEWYEQSYRGHVDADWILPRIFRTPEHVKFTRFEQAKVTSVHPTEGPQQFRLIHGANVSAANPLGVAKKLASKYRSGIVMGHQHWREDGFDVSGTYQCICLGCIANPNNLMYIHKSPTTHPSPTQGFAILKDGWVKSFGPTSPVSQPRIVPSW